MEKEPNNYYEAPIFGELQLTFGATDEKQLVAIKELILDAIEDLGFHGEYEHVEAHWRMSGELVGSRNTLERKWLKQGVTVR